MFQRNMLQIILVLVVYLCRSAVGSVPYYTILLKGTVLCDCDHYDHVIFL